MGITYPLVALSTRLQVRKDAASKQHSLELLRSILEREGARGLFSYVVHLYKGTSGLVHRRYLRERCALET